MEKPKTWLAAIVRPDGIYIQAYIFDEGDDNISAKSLTVTKISDNTETVLEMETDPTGNCIFKYTDRLRLDNGEDYTIELITSLQDDFTSEIKNFSDLVEFTTPTVWSDYDNKKYTVNLLKILDIGKTTVEPRLNVTIGGAALTEGMVLRICASNSQSPLIEYNSYDIMKEFILTGSQSYFSHEFALTISGNWSFRAFLKDVNGTIYNSTLQPHVVNQGDILLLDAVSQRGILKLEKGDLFEFNQVIDGNRVGFTRMNEEGTIQYGSFYKFYDNAGNWYFEYKQSLVGTKYRLPSIQELEQYAAVKNTLVGFKPISYYSNDIVEGTNNVRAWSFNSGAPVTVYAGDNNVGYLVLTDFENNIDEPQSLTIPVFKGNKMVQSSGLSVTDLIRKSDLGSFEEVNY